MGGEINKMEQRKSVRDMSEKEKEVLHRQASRIISKLTSKDTTLSIGDIFLMTKW